MLLRSGFKAKRSNKESPHLADKKAKIDAKNQDGRTPLHIAIENEKMQVVELLLNRADVNVLDNNGKSPLHVAVETGHLQIVNHLLKYGANPNCVCTSKMTKGYAQYSPLHIAVEMGSKEVVKLLLSRGANVDVKGKDSLAPLHIAAKKGYTSIAEDLLNHGACIHSSTLKGGYTPLHFACELGNEGGVELFLNRGADVGAVAKDNLTPLHIAAKKGEISIAEDLLNHGACINSSTLKEGYTPLHFACELGNDGVAKLFLNKGAGVNAITKDNLTPLHIAAKEGYISIAEDLLGHGACIHSLTLKEGYTPLHFACESGNEEVVKLFLNRDADVNGITKDTLTPLHIATKIGHETVVKLLLKHGAKVDKQDKDGKTILHVAVEKGCLNIVEEVLKYCPDINNKRNRSTLKTAVYGRGEEYKMIVEALLEYGFIVNPVDTRKSKLLHVAVIKGYLEVVEHLLKYGANVNTKFNYYDSFDFTPLHRATKNKQEEAVKLLLSYGANINAQDKTGKSPIFYAIVNVDIKITKLLLNNGANVKDDPELLGIAVDKGSIEMVQALLLHDVDINGSDMYGRTALHFTASIRISENEDMGTPRLKGQHDFPDIAKLLLSKGANVDAQTKNGVTTLLAAIKKGFVKLVEALLEYNANVNFRVKNDITLLHISTQIGKEEICTMLLNKGAYVNAKTKDGSTALHFACKNYSKNYYQASKVVKVLLEHDADVNCRDHHGITALHIAARDGRSQLVTNLLFYGSDINIANLRNQTPLNSALEMFDKNNYYFRYDRLTVTALYNHIVKMKVANLYVSEENLLILLNHPYDTGDFQNKCEEEIERMKIEKIDNTDISFYDLLTKGSSLAINARNEKIRKVLNSDDCKTKFPIYTSLLKINFIKFMIRKRLLGQGSGILQFFFNSFPKLYDSSRKIFSYLSDEDLRFLIDASKRQ